MWVEHRKSTPADDKMSLKWALPRHMIHFIFLVPPKISLERLKLEISNLVCMLIIEVPLYGRQTVPERGVVAIM